MGVTASGEGRIKCRLAFFASDYFVVLDKSPNLPEPQFCHVQDESDSGTYFVGFVGRIVQLVFSWCQACSVLSGLAIMVSYTTGKVFSPSREAERIK